ncbi:hypothetical protein ACJX0J_041221, partial [Zea mays]
TLALSSRWDKIRADTLNHVEMIIYSDSCAVTFFSQNYAITILLGKMIGLKLNGFPRKLFKNVLHAGVFLCERTLTGVCTTCAVILISLVPLFSASNTTLTAVVRDFPSFFYLS